MILGNWGNLPYVPCYCLHDYLDNRLPLGWWPGQLLKSVDVILMLWLVNWGVVFRGMYQNSPWPDLVGVNIQNHAAPLSVPLGFFFFMDAEVSWRLSCSLFFSLHHSSVISSQSVHSFFTQKQNESDWQKTLSEWELKREMKDWERLTYVYITGLLEAWVYHNYSGVCHIELYRSHL